MRKDERDALLAKVSDHEAREKLDKVLPPPDDEASFSPTHPVRMPESGRSTGEEVRFRHPSGGIIDGKIVDISGNSAGGFNFTVSHNVLTVVKPEDIV